MAPVAPQRPGVVLRRERLARTPTIDAVIALIERDERPFVLVGRWGLPEGAAPHERVVLAGSRPARTLAPDADPFDALERASELVAVDRGPDGAVGGGYVGWLGFDASRAVERTLGPQPYRPTPLPTTALAWYDNVLRRDPAGVWWVEALMPADQDDPDAALASLVAGWRDRFDTATATVAAPAVLGTMRPRGGGASAHRAAVAEAIERIRAGELFQANVCLRLDGALDGRLAGLAGAVLTRTDPWYGAWIDHDGDRAIVSASPELFLRRRGRAVTTSPIKGTLPRDPAAGNDPAHDPVATALRDSTKDNAEHVMIVDLMRNDLGRVCDYGSIHADAAPAVEPHAGVWHLVSSVRGTLHAGLGDGRLVRATFPPGSVTGAPKVQAMRVIAAVEGTGREVYTGVHGLLSPVSGLDLAVTIRTLEADGTNAWIGVGGGIVADSVPQAELDEALGKAAAIVSAAGSTVDRGTASTHAAPHIRWPASAASRPDPDAGILETIGVRDGRPQRAPEHLARLRGSAQALGLAVPTGLAEQVDAAAAAGPLDAPERTRGAERTAMHASPGRIRIELRGGRSPDVTFVPFPAVPATGVPLAPVVLPGGLGPHKWRDRTLLAALDPGDGHTALLLDADGAVLEAAWANVWWEDEHGQLCTPALDGRVLPGVARAALLRQLGRRAVQAPPTAYPALAGRPLLLTSARGVTPAYLAETPPQARQRAQLLAVELDALLAGRPR
jgi:para-aminobenzoate synthetase/4-amino-4-deoxychorismate lyase